MFSQFVNGDKFGELASAVYLQKNGQNAFYNVTFASQYPAHTIGNQNFVQNIGTFQQGTASLVLLGAEIKTWKEPASANVCSARLNYVVYPAGVRPANPVFKTITLPKFTECIGGVFPVNGGQCLVGRDQKWQLANANIDLTALCPGPYVLEIYFDFLGSNISSTGCETRRYIGDYGRNYKMNFAINGSGGSKILFTYDDEGNQTSRTIQILTCKTSLRKKESEEVTDDLSPAEEVQMKMYPNPTKDIVHIDAPTKEQGVRTVFVFDFSGKLIKEFSFANITQNTEIDLTTLPANNYLLQVQSSNGEQFTQKIIKL